MNEAGRDIVYEQIEPSYSRSGFNESVVEDAAVSILESLGYQYLPA